MCAGNILCVSNWNVVAHGDEYSCANAITIHAKTPRKLCISAKYFHVICIIVGGKFVEIMIIIIKSSSILWD